MDSALYLGSLRHRRFSPKRHEFTYPLFMTFLDVDRISELMQVSRLTSYNRWNWASYHESDHFGDARLPLRMRLERDAAAQGLELPDGRIFLLTHLRYLGYNFNPVSFFYCYDRQERLQMVMAEVNNTFAETHNYWLSQPLNEMEMADKAEKAPRYRFRKQLHVSPFMQLNCQYDWTFTAPTESLVVQSNVQEAGQPTFDSTLKLERRPWSAPELRSVLARFPWVTAKVIAGIHWQAVRLYCKGVPVVTHPGAGHFTPVTTKHLGASWKAD